MLTVGVVGPSALGEQTQKIVHHIVGSPQPQGWDNQLHDEPGVDLTWRGLLEGSPFAVGVDMVPQAGATVGNVDTYAAVGTTLRLGYDLPQDYGPPRIRPSMPGSDFFIPTKEVRGYLSLLFKGESLVEIFSSMEILSKAACIQIKNFFFEVCSLV